MFPYPVHPQVIRKVTVRVTHIILLVIKDCFWITLEFFFTDDTLRADSSITDSESGSELSDTDCFSEDSSSEGRSPAPAFILHLSMMTYFGLLNIIEEQDEEEEEEDEEPEEEQVEPQTEAPKRECLETD